MSAKYSYKPQSCCDFVPRNEKRPSAIFFHRTSQPKFQMSFNRNQKHQKLRRKTKFLEGNRIVHCEEVFHSLGFYLEVLKIPSNVPQIFLDNGSNFVFRMLYDQASTRIKTQTFVGTTGHVSGVL